MLNSLTVSIAQGTILSFKTWFPKTPHDWSPEYHHQLIKAQWHKYASVFSKLTIIGSDNGSSPCGCQAIIWTNAGILNWTLRNKIQQYLNQNSSFHSRKCIWICLSAKWYPFCLSLNVLKKKTPEMHMWWRYKSASDWAMAWHQQAAHHYQFQCCRRSRIPKVPKLQWVNLISCIRHNGCQG